MSTTQVQARPVRPDKVVSNIVHMRQIVQVKKSRAWGHATVDLVKKDGSIESRDKTLVVKFPVDAQELAKEGSLWEVSGKEFLKSFKVNGYVVNEYVIDADEIKFLRPSGKILARWLSSNIKGIGTVIAKRLVRLKNLEDLIAFQDKASLLEIAGMSEERVERLLEQWPAPNLYQTIEWLEKQQLPLNLGEKLVGIFGADAIERVKAHPFLLMGMGVSFEKTMAMANELKLSMADNAVMAGVALHAAVKHSATTGSTVIDAKTLVRQCTEVMASSAPAHIGDVAVEEGYLVKAGNAYQVYGKALMETAVAQFLVDAYTRRPGAHALLAAWEKDVTRTSVESAVLDYESSLGFALTNEQRMAVVGAVMSPVCCISGGAGTGKTTILKAILGVYDSLAVGMPCYQVALSGRAAQKMASSTGAPAQTIAKLIANHVGDKKPDLPPHLLLVIDEASMVDLLSMYRLVSLLPSATRILFVGDTSQLPPVGDGLVFHALFGTPIQFFNLSQVKRQSDQSGIHRFATGVRESALEMPKRTQATLAESEDCSIEPNADMTRLISLWREAGGIGNIVLSPVRKGMFGVENINTQLQEAVGLSRKVLYYRDELRGWIPWITPTSARLLEEDPVLVVANNYEEDADLRNGDLGVITEVFRKPDEVTGAVGILEVNGVAVYITPGILIKLQLGYAVTIHKSQGSQWPTCFVMLPPEASRMIDQTLIYTAVTRPTDRLVLFGDEAVVEQAVKRGSIALERRTCLRERILAAAQA